MRRLQASQNSSGDTVDLLLKNAFGTFGKLLFFSLGLFSLPPSIFGFTEGCQWIVHILHANSLYFPAVRNIYSSQMPPSNALPGPLSCASPEQGELSHLSAQQTLFSLLPSGLRATTAGHGRASWPVLSHHHIHGAEVAQEQHQLCHEGGKGQCQPVVVPGP